MVFDYTFRIAEVIYLQPRELLNELKELMQSLLLFALTGHANVLARKETV